LHRPMLPACGVMRPLRGMDGRPAAQRRGALRAGGRGSISTEGSKMKRVAQIVAAVGSVIVLWVAATTGKFILVFAALLWMIIAFSALV
jgi:hypothetical protein